MTDEERSMIEWRAGLRDIGLERQIVIEKARIASKFDREWDRLYWHARLALGLIIVVLVARIVLLVVS